MSGYARVEFWIARSDAAILETRYFKQRHASPPYKVIHAPRADTRQLGGHALPTRILVENLARGTQTEVWIEQLSIDSGSRRRHLHAPLRSRSGARFRVSSAEALPGRAAVGVATPCSSRRKKIRPGVTPFPAGRPLTG